MGSRSHTAREPLFCLPLKAAPNCSGLGSDA